MRKGLQCCQSARAVYQLKVNRDVPAVVADSFTAYDSVIITGLRDNNDGVRRDWSYSAGLVKHLYQPDETRRVNMRNEKNEK